MFGFFRIWSIEYFRPFSLYKGLESFILPIFNPLSPSSKYRRSLSLSLSLSLFLSLSLSLLVARRTENPAVSFAKEVLKMQAKSGFSTSSPLSQQHLFTAACTFAGGRERVCMSPGASILHSPRATCEPRRSIMRANFAIQNVEEQDYGLPYIYTYASLSLPKGFLRVSPAFYSEIGEREREREREGERERGGGSIAPSGPRVPWWHHLRTDWNPIPSPGACLLPIPPWCVSARSPWRPSASDKERPSDSSPRGKGGGVVR